LRVLPQISVSTADTKYELTGSKIVIVKAGTTAVLVSLGHLKGIKDGDTYTIPANTTYKFTSEKGRLFYCLWCYVSSGTSTLDVAESNDDVELIQ